MSTTPVNNQAPSQSIGQTTSMEVTQNGAKFRQVYDNSLSTTVARGMGHALGALGQGASTVLAAMGMQSLAAPAQKLSALGNDLTQANSGNPTVLQGQTALGASSTGASNEAPGAMAAGTFGNTPGAFGAGMGGAVSRVDGTAFGAGVNPLPGSMSGGAGLGGGTTTGIPGIGGGTSTGGVSGGGDSQSQLMAATQQMQETQMSFNLQYLQLQNNMQQDNRVYTTMSNVMKTKHDTVKNSISNIR